MPDNRVNVALPALLHRKLKALHKKSGVPLTAMIRQAVSAYIQEWQKQERIANGR